MCLRLSACLFLGCYHSMPVPRFPINMDHLQTCPMTAIRSHASLATAPPSPLQYATAGIVLFDSAFNRICVHEETGELENFYGDADMFGCGGWRSCPANFTCKEFGSTTATNTAGFNNFGRALLTVFQVGCLYCWKANCNCKVLPGMTLCRRAEAGKGGAHGRELRRPESWLPRDQQAHECAQPCAACRQSR